VSDLHRLAETLRTHLDRPTSGFSIGSFGAIAEFHRRSDEPAVPPNGGGIGAVTDRGALRVALRGDASAHAYETLSRDGRRWQQGVVFCVPETGGGAHRRRALTPLGPDTSAIRPADAGAHLFDMGLGARNIDFLVRTDDPALIRLLERHAGEPLLAAGPGGPMHFAMAAIVEASPHRLAVSALGRLEVYQAIGRERTPEGPHTHVLPKFLASGRTHPANVPVPPGRLPALTLHPASAVSDADGRPTAYDPDRQAAFEALRAAFGDPDAIAVRQRIRDAVAAGLRPDAVALPADRRLRTAARVALRQLRAQGLPADRLRPWQERFDPSGAAADADRTDLRP